jgi:tRNA-2-methylthio-N6-dimethylallyladenosine synthase
MTVPDKKVFVKTYGCQMNVYDSERMRDVLAPLGYSETSIPEDADLVILNTCHIREKAAEKVYSELGQIRKLKTQRARHGLDTKVAVAGCVAQAEGAEIVRRAPVVDLVFGPQTYHRLPELLAEKARRAGPVIEAAFPSADKFKALAGSRKPVAGVTAFITVQEGCDKFCSFCVVPYTRGAEVSRHPADIEREAAALAEAGVREVTLLGQNVNAYHGGEAAPNLASLVARLSRIDGIQRIRYMTSHPRDMDAGLIAAHADNDKLMPYLHLPIQAGSDRILKAMNRGHTADSYLRLIEKIRAARPDIAISGDFIVGFPGETDEDFHATLDVVRQVQYASAFSFKYSPRPGTPAAERETQVPEEVKLARLHELQALLAEQQRDFNRACIGRTLPVLIEKPGRRAGQMMGRSPYLQPVHLDVDAGLLGQIIHVEIAGVGTNSLSGHYRVAA